MSKQVATIISPLTTRAIYDEYAGLLLGYIYEVVKDKNMAEQYLISVFNELPQQLHHMAQPGVNVYQRLQLLARKMLTDFFETIPACKPDDKSHLPAAPNKFLQRMSEEEQLVFCNIHFSGKSVSTLSAELNKPEEVIKKILQQAFAAIRRSA